MMPLGLSVGGGRLGLGQIDVSGGFDGYCGGHHEDDQQDQENIG